MIFAVNMTMVKFATSTFSGLAVEHAFDKGNAYNMDRITSYNVCYTKLLREPLDLIYSNAALHWLDDHAALMPRLMGLLKPGGVLAVQMPRNYAAPAHKALGETLSIGPWRERLAALLRPEPVSPPEVYDELISPLASRIDVCVITSYSIHYTKLYETP